MSEHYNMFVVAWLFILLIGVWVLVNALIDLGAKRVRRWFSDRLGDQSAIPSRITINPHDRH